MKKLKSKVDKDEAVVFTTDKSSRLSIATPDQYKDILKSHFEKDKKIDDKPLNLSMKGNLVLEEWEEKLLGKEVQSQKDETEHQKYETENKIADTEHKNGVSIIERKVSS